MLRGGSVPGLLVEPPGPHLRGRRQSAAGPVHLSGGPSGPLRRAALAAAAAVVATSSGDTVLLAALLGVAAADVGAGAVALLAASALAVRWGSTSLDAIADAQSVLGPGAVVGPAAAVGAAWCAAAALVVAAPKGWPALAFGAAAALAVAGPGPGGPRDIALRVAAMAAGVACAVVAGRRLPARPARAAALILATAALGLAVAS